MKLNNKNSIILVFFVFIIVIYILFFTKSKKSSPEGKFIVYGTEWCGYTTKQRNHLDNKYGKGSHKFVDCDGGDCPGIDAFPVTKTPYGKMVKGFNTEL